MLIIDKILECLNEKIVEGYYLDKMQKMYKKCDKSCKSCQSTIGCLECDIDNGYLQLEDDQQGNI